MRGEPDWALFPTTAPAAVRQLVEQCLVKNRTERISDMSVVRFLLSDRTHAGSALSATAPVVMPASRRATVGWPVIAGLVAAAVLATAGAMQVWGPGAADASAGRVTRLSISLPEGDQLNLPNQLPMAVSPDGSAVVYDISIDDRRFLRVQQVKPEAGVTQIDVVLNWMTQLGRR